MIKFRCVSAIFQTNANLPTLKQFFFETIATGTVEADIVKLEIAGHEIETLV